jgi:flagellar hook-associated protein 1 FlgK
MSLDASLGVASSSLANIMQGFAVISQNVANADTTGYATEQSTVQSLDAGGMGIGARSGPTQLVTNASLQNLLYGQNAASSAADTTNAALNALQPALGSVGQGNDLGSLLTNVQNGFSALLNDPSSQPQQQAVVNAAQSLTQQINSLAGAYGQAEQTAQNSIVSGVAALNSALGQIGSISSQIVALKASGGSTADLENQRNAVMTTVSGLVGARFSEQPDGNMMVFTTGGAQLPTDTSTPLSIAGATTSPSTYYPGGGVPGVMLGTADITSQIGGGSIGANIALRDTTLPTYTGELDEFSQNLAGNFSAQGLTLFSDGQGNVPATGGVPAQANYLGFSSIITVNSAVAATPSLVRDGTQAIAGNATGASAFTPNPDGLAGFTGMIDRVLNYALGPDVQAGVAQPAPNTTGLGASGTLSAPFSAPATLGDFTTDITASQSADSANATTAATETSATRQAFSGQLQSATGVNMDSQMSLMIQLQNAYGANAKVISTIQAMDATLLSAVQ